MLRTWIVALLVVLVTASAASAHHKPWHGQSSTPPAPPSVSTTLLDEQFSGAAGAPPDPTRWYRYDYCDRWGSLSCNVPANAVLDGAGSLALTARYAPGHRDRYGNTANWTGARIESGRRWENTALFSYFHGTASAWIKMPRAVGTWGAFWELNLKDSLGRYGEIDAVEALGHETPGGVWHANLHTWTNTTHGANVGRACDLNQDLTAAFHKYTAEWAAGRIEIFLDDVLCLTATSSQLAWYFDFKPAILLLSLDVGGWGGTPTVSQYPSTMLVSRVLVTS